MYVGHSYGSLPVHARLQGLSPESRLVVIDGFAPDTGDSGIGRIPVIGTGDALWPLENPVACAALLAALAP